MIPFKCVYICVCLLSARFNSFCLKFWLNSVIVIVWARNPPPHIHGMAAIWILFCYSPVSRINWFTCRIVSIFSLALFHIFFFAVRRLREFFHTSICKHRWCTWSSYKKWADIISTVYNYQSIIMTCILHIHSELYAIFLAMAFFIAKNGHWKETTRTLLFLFW